MVRPTARFRDALEILARHHVDLIVVGGVACVLNGAPISTFDLDIVHARSSENVHRLVAALTELDARYRDLAGRVLRPDAAALSGPGHHLLVTNCGPVDVFGEIGNARSFDDLVEETSQHSIAGHAIRILELPALIRTKEEANREKDRVVLPILRRTLEERKRSG